MPLTIPFLKKNVGTNFLNTNHSIANVIKLSANSMLKERTNGITEPRYTNRWTKLVIDEVFGDLKVGEIKRYFAIPAFRLDNECAEHRKWEAEVFSNIIPKYSDELMGDVIMRSCAAPTYFQQYQGYHFVSTPHSCNAVHSYLIYEEIKK